MQFEWSKPVVRRLSAMSAVDAKAAAAAALPAATDRVAVLKEERKNLKRQLAAATKELQN